MDRVASISAFVKVVDSGGFTAAARSLNMSPQGVSNSIKTLEEDLGVRLLNRTTRKISLTEIGHAYYERCTQILMQIEEADQLAVSLHSTLKGTLRINATTSLSPFIAPIISEFVACHPAMTVDLTATENMVDLIEEEYDLAVRISYIEESSLVVHRLAAYRFVVCASPDYLAAHGTPQHPADLAGHNFCIFSTPPWSVDWRFKDGASEHVVRLTGNMRSNNGEACRTAALHGNGLVVTPDYTALEHLKTGRFVLVLPDYPLLPERAISVVYPHRRHLSAKVRSFIDLLASRFADGVAWTDRFTDRPTAP